METIQTVGVPADQIDDLERYAVSEAGVEMRLLLLDLVRFVREGVELAPVVSENAVTPNQMADLLGMSRGHAYKLLDQGQIKSYRVGRDRRVQLVDVLAFAARRREDRHELAHRFASQPGTRAAAIDEIADTL